MYDDLIHFAEHEFGFPLLDIEHDPIEYKLQHEQVIGNARKGNYYYE